MSTIGTSYDDLPYESYAFGQTHPANLAMVGRLFGLQPPNVNQCRVLELGCAAGGNLLPMALAYPNSSFLGLDLSGVQIRDGVDQIKTLGLRNVELRQMDLLDFGPEMGQFDYVLCHGVFSWVPPVVQDKILQILQDHLDPYGIAFVSFNCYPGWHMRGIIRDMLLYHSQQFATPGEKIGQARRLLEFMAQAQAQQQTPYAMFLRQQLEEFQKIPDTYLFHEHLEENNHPMYFHQFEELATKKKLRYLGEASLREMTPRVFSQEIQEVLHNLAPDQVHLEQYLDFLRNRTFRQGLLCHDNLQPNYEMTSERLHGLAIASKAKPEKPEALNIFSTEVQKFVTQDGSGVDVSGPLLKATMLVLAETFPQAMPFKQLVEAARKKLNRTSSRLQDEDEIGHMVLTTHATASAEVMELHLYPPVLCSVVSARPTAHPVARIQAARKKVKVTNYRHEMVDVDDFCRRLLILLDGTRDVPALLAGMRESLAKDQVKLQKDGQLLSVGPQWDAVVLAGIEKQLKIFAATGLLGG